MKAYAFLMRRPRDTQAWPVIYTDRERAEAAFGRVSPVIEVELTEVAEPADDWRTTRAYCS